MKSFYVIIEDPEALICSDGTYCTNNTRVLIEEKQAFGFDNLARHFNAQEFQQFFNLIRSQLSGTYKHFTWKRE